jgi:hypothetical protein
MKSFFIFSLFLGACDSEMPPVATIDPITFPTGGDRQFCRYRVGEYLCDPGLQCGHLMAAAGFGWGAWRCIDMQTDPIELFDIFYQAAARIPPENLFTEKPLSK